MNGAPSSVADKWAELIHRFRGWIVLGWIAVAVFVRWIAPTWDQVAYDGDFDYLPAHLSSVAGGRLIDEAFPADRSRSQIVLLVARDSGELDPKDELVGLDLLRRLYHRLAEVSWQRAIELGYQTGPIQEDASWKRWVELTQSALDDAIRVDTEFYTLLEQHVPDTPPNLEEPRLAIAYWDRGHLREHLQSDPDGIASDYELALVLVPELPKLATPVSQRPLTGWKNLLDVLSWRDSVMGSRLSKAGARLAVLEMSSELAATENIDSIEAIEQLLTQVRKYSGQYARPGLRLALTGSAAIGGETLIAARAAIRYTELFTILLILAILVVVYRAPLLIAIPMISILLAVVTAVGLVTLITEASARDALLGLDLRVFTTSRIFVVVILFGAGTDFCLFLIARLREEATRAEWDSACQKALSGVSSALLGSAFTTIVGLAMLWIAEFGKFHHTGPIIALCLCVGLLVCMTFTPALLGLLGPRVFWPNRLERIEDSGLFNLGNRTTTSTGIATGLWPWIALFITRRPMALLALGIGVLLLPAAYGWKHEDGVTYDLSSELSPSASSRQGLALLQQHFDIGEINPVTVLVLFQQPMAREQLATNAKLLRETLYGLPSVLAVRTANDPLGDFPPQREMGLLSKDAWKRRALRTHRLAQQQFVSPHPSYEHRLIRLDAVIEGDPFAIETGVRVATLQRVLKDQIATLDFDHANPVELLLAGTTPSIMDLREVTLRDNRRIKVGVALAVFVVLLLVIRRFGLCLYLIATVLLSYYATLGLCVAWFRWSYGTDYVGLDWKLPLFLFVILVAVGQDYNVYLVTRILEEQRKLGWIAALRKAVGKTGGIITACGVVMAATFFSMTSSAWFPPIAASMGVDSTDAAGTLRGITELGFALGLGVLIDTFYVRTILVPSFVAILGRYSALSRS
jgi:RND superfamily putative drug exporter